jgi:hypothetical protein
VLSSIGNNNANFLDPILGLTDPVSGLTPVGAFLSSPGSFGTYDMGGDVSEFTETGSEGGRVILGGPWNLGVSSLESNSSYVSGASGYGSETGFRVAEVPEPSSLTLLAAGSLALLCRGRRTLK